MSNGVQQRVTPSKNGAEASNGQAKPAAAQEAKVEGLEFGGVPGALALMIWSHLQLYYFWYCMVHNDSSIFISDWRDMLSKIVAECKPSWRAVGAYAVFIFAQALLGAFMPGHMVQGYPLAHLGGKRLSYCCNGLGCWTTSLLAFYWLHTSKTFPLSGIMEDLGGYMTSAIILSDVCAVGAYVGAHIRGTTHRMTGLHFYDFFMGAPLNPRIGPLDLKMFTEARVSWIVLFTLTLSAALRQYELHGTVSSPMIFMVVAHGLYTHTIMRGEEGIPVTWDIFYEKWGWLLIFWNMAGVPFTYCYQSIYLLNRPPFEHEGWYTAACFALLLCSWALWDVSNSQRCYFRMQIEGTFRDRLGLYLPWLPWRVIKDPEYIQTEHGSKLLVSGFWGMARKVNYTADIGMALSWGLICGFDSFIPYFYFVFFLAMIIHRAHRDQQRCAAKYKADWVRYCEKVPYTFIPGII